MAQATTYQGLIPRFAEQQAQRQGALSDQMMAQKFGQELATKEMKRREAVQEKARILKGKIEWLKYAPRSEQDKILHDVGREFGINLDGADPTVVIKQFDNINKMMKEGGPPLANKGMEAMKNEYGLNPLYKDMLLQKERELAASQGQAGMEKQAFMETGKAPSVGGAGGSSFPAKVYADWINSGDPVKVQKAKDMLAYKRQQAQEAGDVVLAKRIAKIETAFNLKAEEKKAERESAFKAAAPKARNAINSLNQQWDLVDNTLDEAIKNVSPWTTGLGAWMSVIPATPQKDLKEELETIRANVGFDKLQQMRADSPSGGALGQISDFEDKLLQAVKGSISQTQSPAQLKRNLLRIKNDLKKLRIMKNKAFKIDYGKYLNQGQSTLNGSKKTNAETPGSMPAEITTKSGRKARLNERGEYEYID